jgi:bacillithiol biosynthesis cysteine-adding enzyme BshC
MRIEHLPADVLGLSPVARAARAGTLRTAFVPRRLDDIPRPAERHEPEQREELSRALQRSLAPLGPHIRVLDALRALARPGVPCVVTGQQPGFLTSPLLSLYKALQAVRLAERLGARWDVPVVAVFWNHADDHDVAEVHHAHLVNENLDLQKLALAGMSSGRLPVSQIVLDEDEHRLAAIRARLGELVGGGVHGAEALALFVPRAGESLARAFTRSMTELLGHTGLVVLEPDAVRDPLSHALAGVVGRAPAPARERGAAAVRAEGLEPAIEPLTAALVYRHEENGRRPLRSGGDGFRYDGEPGSRTPAELAAEIVQEPSAWSPGALLRPIVQDLVLPVCAYVGGFGELAYHLELGDLRTLVGAPATPFVPRVSCTLVDPECAVALKKVDVALKDYLRTKGTAAEDDVESAGDVPAVANELRAAAERAAQDIEDARAGLEELDRGLAIQARKTAEQVRSLVDKLAAKAERVQRNRTGKGRRHQRRLATALLPRGDAQERVLGPLPFVARFGREWVDELAAAIDPLAPEHMALYFDDDGRTEDET